MVESDNEYLETMEELNKIIALWSGIRAQFVEQGWHPAHAEIATLELVRRVSR